MKVSVLTPTYNRGELLKNIYHSLLENANYGVEIEWLIMDDGSTDETEKIVKEFLQDKITIYYFKQENQGKMMAINHLMKYVTGELIIDCDSDDYFIPNAFQIIKNEYEKNKDIGEIYGFCFLKQDTIGKNIGKNFSKEKTTMFDLYFKEGEDGEKAIVFYSSIRKQYKHELEQGEKFVTEARMYHKMDQNYQIICVNQPIMICEYKEDGYTKNIQKQFIQNPYGYYQYFSEILQKNMKQVGWKKRLYVIKHYILFSYLTKQYHSGKIRNLGNKLLYFLLWVPGVVKSAKYKIDKNNIKPLTNKEVQ